MRSDTLAVRDRILAVLREADHPLTTAEVCEAAGPYLEVRPHQDWMHRDRDEYATFYCTLVSCDGDTEVLSCDLRSGQRGSRELARFERLGLGAGFIDYPSAGTVALTDAGRAVATPADIERTTAGLQDAIFRRLAEPERRVLAGVVDAYPDSLTKQDAGEQAGYTVGAKVGGTFGNILGRLRSLGLIDYPAPGQVVATDVLFLGGVA